jgi:hypothetical protein
MTSSTPTTHDNSNDPITVPQAPPQYHVGMTDDEVVAYVDRYLPQPQTTPQMLADDVLALEALSRYGSIKAAQRSAAIASGHTAELMIAQRKLDVEARVMAIAHIAKSSAAQQRQERPELPIEVTIAVAGQTLTLSAADIVACFPNGSSQISMFVTAIAHLANVAEQCANYRANKVNTGNGKNLGLPFNFMQVRAEILNAYQAENQANSGE